MGYEDEDAYDAVRRREGPCRLFGGNVQEESVFKTMLSNISKR